MRLEALVKNHRDIFEFIYTNNQGKWERLLEVIYRNGDFEDNKLNYFASTTLQRNPYYSNIYSFYCSVILIKTIIDNGVKLDRLEVEFPFQRKIINNYLLIENINNVRIFSQKGNIFSYFFEKLLKSLSFLKFIYKSFSIFNLKWFNNKRSYKIYNSLDYVILETFGSSDFIKKRMFLDRNHGEEFVNNLIGKYGNELLIIPDLEFWKLKAKDLNWYFNFSKSQFILKCDFLNFNDFIAILRIGLFRKLSFENIIIDKIDLTSYFNFEKNVNKWSSLYHLYNYFFYRRFSKLCDVKLFYDWWENQIIDKITLFSVNKYFSKCTKIGIISYMIDVNYNFYLRPTNYELTNNLLPDKFQVWSLKYSEYLYNIDNKLSIEKLAPNRYSYLIEKKLFNPDNKKIIVLLPSIFNDAIFILETLFCSNHDILSMGYDLSVKSHPNLNLSGMKYDSVFNFVNPSAFEFENYYSIVVSSVSSAIFESIVLGKYVVILSESPYIQTPGMLNIPTLIKASNYLEFKNGIIFFENLNWNEEKIKLSNLKHEYFE